MSQNSRAAAAYPSLNGSRFEHALGTMHLSMKAWRIAWANFWGDHTDGGAADPEPSGRNLQTLSGVTWSKH